MSASKRRQIQIVTLSERGESSGAHLLLHVAAAQGEAPCVGPHRVELLQRNHHLPCTPPHQLTISSLRHPLQLGSERLVRTGNHQHADRTASTSCQERQEGSGAHMTTASITKPRQLHRKTNIGGGAVGASSNGARHRRRPRAVRTQKDVRAHAHARVHGHSQVRGGPHRAKGHLLIPHHRCSTS